MTPWFFMIVHVYNILNLYIHTCAHIYSLQAILNAWLVIQAHQETQHRGKEFPGNFWWIQGLENPTTGEDGTMEFYTTSTLQPKRMTSNDLCIDLPSICIFHHIPIDSLDWSCRMKHQFNVVARCRKALSTLIRSLELLGLRSRWRVHTDAYLGNLGYMWQICLWYHMI